MQPTSEILDRIKSVILQNITPRKIVLFGSAARGDMSKQSDIDLLIIVPDGIDKVKAAWTIYPLLSDLGIGVDLVFAHEQEIAQKSDDRNLIYYSALQDGREIYAA